MDIILVPGLWLDASSWDDVIPLIEAAGHSAHPLTMPGTGGVAADTGDIGMADWVAAVVDEIDALTGPVALIGHSGGGNVIHGAVDARPDRVARAIYVDAFPPIDGGIIWDEFPVVDGIVPFPGWDSFDESEIHDLDPDTRADVARRALSVPEKVPSDPIRLHDERRYDVPATVITCSVPVAAMRGFMADNQAWVGELNRITGLELVELPAGHWPQFSRPADLSESIVTALAG